VLNRKIHAGEGLPGDNQETLYLDLVQLQVQHKTKSVSFQMLEKSTTRLVFSRKVLLVCIIGSVPSACAGRSNDRKRLGPIMIEEILDGPPTFSKHDLTVREMTMITDPTNESSPVIKRKFKPLDNPSNVLDVLQGVLLTIKEGAIRNNVATGPLQHRFWRRCLTGTALDKFNEHTLAVGNETAANLHTVEQRLIMFFAPREVLRQQTRCIRFHMRKPKEVSARQHVGAVATLNDTLSKLPPGFDDLQKVSDTDMMDILVSKAPKGHKELMTDHGFDPQTEVLLA
jgi:hypothetical protein